MKTIKLVNTFVKKEIDTTIFEMQLLDDGTPYVFSETAVIRLIIENKGLNIVNKLVSVADRNNGIVTFDVNEQIADGKYDCEFIVYEGETISTFPTIGYQVFQINKNLERETTGETIQPSEFEILIERIESAEKALSEKANAQHGHTIPEIEGLQSNLDSKSNVGHTHEMQNINGLLEILDAKEDINHLHEIEDVTGLQENLNTLQTNIDTLATDIQTEMEEHDNAVRNDMSSLETRLQGNVDTLANTLNAKDVELQTNINNAQNTLQGNINQVQTNLTNAQTTLEGNINQVQTNLTNTQTTLQGAINNNTTIINNNVSRLDYIQNSVTATETLTDRINALPDNAGNFVEVAKVQGNTVQNLCANQIIAGFPSETEGYYTLTEITNGLKFTATGQTTYSWWVFSAGDQNIATMVKPSTNYTIIFDFKCNKEMTVIATLMDSAGTNEFAITRPNVTLQNGRVVLKLTTKNSIEVNKQRVYINLHSSAVSEFVANDYVEISNVMLLEGDWTNRTDIPDYFTGIQSVQDSVQVKSVGKNLCNTNDYKLTTNYGNGDTSLIKADVTDNIVTLDISAFPNANTGAGLWIPAKLEKQKYYTLTWGNVSGTVNNIRIYKENMIEVIHSPDIINNGNVTFYSSNETLAYFRFWVNGTCKASISNIMIEEGNVATAYEPYQETTMQIPLAEPLHAIVDTGENVVYADEIKNGKIIRKIGKKVITSNLEFNTSQYYQDDEGNYKYVALTFPDTDVLSAYSNNIYCICDKFPSTFPAYVFNTSDNGIYNMISVRRGGNQGVSIRILMSELEAIDSENPVTTNAIQQWLANKGDITVYYVKNEPIVEELIIPNDAILQTYQNGHILLENTPVRPKVDVQYAIGLQGKILKLETEIAENEVVLSNLFDANDVLDYWNGGN